MTCECLYRAAVWFNPADCTRSNPFITKSAPMSPAKRQSTPVEDGMTLLQDGMKSISIASRSGTGDLSATLVGKENGSTSGREVSCADDPWEPIARNYDSYSARPLRTLPTAIPAL